MPAIISNDLRIFNSDSFQDYINQYPAYVFIGRETAWDNESNPPTPIDSDAEKTEIFSDLLAVKNIGDADIQSVVPRYDWVSGTVYDEYNDQLNMIDGTSPISGNFQQFYVVTDEFNVYKCISNNNGVTSTVKPTGNSINSFQTVDGYIWKYMYTIRASDVFSFLSQEWMPCYSVKSNDGSSQWQVQQNSVDGSIEHIIVENGGANYDDINPPTVVITGDGTGASATATVDENTGEITKIIVTNIGQDYTEATISFTNVGAGVGASARAVLSPVGGHGSDARSELGATYKMVRLQLDGDEGGVFPTSSYRQAGIISVPLEQETGSKLYLNNTSIFQVGETVTGDTSGATGVIRLINSDYIYVSDVTGAFLQSEDVSDQFGQTANLSAVDVGVNLPLDVTVANISNIVSRSGTILYYSNREAISRTQDQLEDLRFIISF